MPLSSPSTAGLDIEDFRRLGVRPHECRLTVIRQAAMRSARALAEKQLDAPSPQVEIQLSRVATSAYRLLDPRQRNNTTQRVHVGRILPNALTWAGQTNFYSGKANRSVGVPFGGDSISNQELIEMLDLDAADRSGAERQPRDDVAWSINLQDGDLINARPGNRYLAQAQRSVKHPWVWLAVLGVMIGTLLGLVTLHRHHDSKFRLVEASARSADPSSELSVGVGTSEDQTPVVEARTPETQSIAASPQASDSQASESRASESQTPSRVPEIVQEVPTTSRATTVHTSSAALAGSEGGHAETKTSPLKPTSPLESGLDSQVTPGVVLGGPERAPTETATQPGTSSLEDAFSTAKSSASISGPAQNSAGAPSPKTPTDAYLADPFLTPRPVTPPPGLSDVMLPDLESSLEPDRDPKVEPAATEDAAPLERVFPVPSEAEVRLARRQLTLVVPQLANAVSPQQVPQRIASVESLEGELAIGSADHWAARLLVAELAWLVEDPAQVSERLTSLVDHYGVTHEQPLSDSFIAACELANRSSTHRHLLDHGLRLANHLMTSESLEDCRRVVQSMQVSAEFLQSEDDRVLLDQFSQALDQADRLSESSQRLLDDRDAGVFSELEVSKVDAGILGRYFCLTLRRWEQGLPWLAEASDARLASVARQEANLEADASAEDLAVLSKRWFAAASRTTGYSSDSLRLHAIDILRSASQQASGLKKLEMERTIDSAVESLPEYLRGEGKLFDAAAADVDSPGASSPALPDKTEGKPGLSGRIEVDGNDIGVQLDYELDVAMNQSVLDRIADRLNRPLSKVSIKMVGEFQLAEASKVSLATSQPQPEASYAIQVDGQVRDLDPLDNGVEISLDAGTHTLAWTVTAVRLPQSYLRFHDVKSGRRIQVVHPTIDIAKPTVLTVSMVRSER